MEEHKDFDDLWQSIIAQRDSNRKAFDSMSTTLQKAFDDLRQAFDEVRDNVYSTDMLVLKLASTTRDLSHRVDEHDRLIADLQRKAS